MLQLTVYDVLGREVEVLVNDFKSAGIYELTLNAENLPSGLYIYTLEVRFNENFKENDTT